MSKAKILIVDDEKNTRDGLRRALQRNYDVLTAEGGRQALDLLAEQAVDVVLSDIRMPGMDGLTLIQRILGREGAPICILLTAYGSVETAVEAMKRGAYDFLTKPVNLDRLEIILQRALRSRDVEQENRQLHQALDKKYGLDNIIGNSPPMQEVFETIRQVATSKATVLIQGESGTGKELVAHAIHNLSPRSKAAFVAVHCAALSSTLLESELFGHEKGSFTGANELRKGRFELADGGSLFLDEIGEVDLNVQVKILRVLEERQFERVGGQHTIDTDVRLIAATNKDLHAMMEQGTFREDLFYRLNVVMVELPPLRARGDDIPLLAEHYIQQVAGENGKEIESISPEAMDLMSRYSWPGNVRELRNAVERMVVLSRGSKLSVRDVPAFVKGDESGGSSSGMRLSAGLSMEEAEKQLIIKALKDHRGHRTKAAEQLGISRRTLHRKLNQYGLRDDE